MEKYDERTESMKSQSQKSQAIKLAKLESESRAEPSTEQIAGQSTENKTLSRGFT